MSSPLPTAILGRTGLEVTRLGFGTSLVLPEKPYWTEEAAAELYHQVLDLGMNFVDTAYDYIFAEEWLGRILRPRYDQFHLATKCGCTDSRPAQNASNHLWTRDNLMRNIEVSLRRLQRDSVDLMQPHNPTVAEAEAGGIVVALNEMRDAGQIKHIGISTTLPHLPRFLDWGVFDTMQIPYSALEREHEDWITKAGEAGVGIIVRGGVSQGEPASGIPRDDSPSMVMRDSIERWQKFATAGLDELRAEGESRSAFMLRFTLSHPHVHTIIVGTTRSEHLTENAAAARRGPLADDVYAEAKRRLDAIGESPVPV